MNSLEKFTVATRRQIVQEIEAELAKAYSKHGSERWSRHEFFSIMKEKVDETWDDIKQDAPRDKLRKEIIQVAAMCVRFLETGARHDRC